jgi:hypothetical protein
LPNVNKWIWSWTTGWTTDPTVHSYMLTSCMYEVHPKPHYPEQNFMYCSPLLCARAHACACAYAHVCVCVCMYVCINFLMSLAYSDPYLNYPLSIYCPSSTPLSATAFWIPSIHLCSVL